MTTEMTLQQAMDMANSVHASKQEKVLVDAIENLQCCLQQRENHIDRLQNLLGKFGNVVIKQE